MKLNVLGLLAAFSMFGCAAHDEASKLRIPYPGFIQVWLIIIMKENVGQELSCLGRIVYGWLLMDLICRMDLLINCMK